MKKKIDDIIYIIGAGRLGVLVSEIVKRHNRYKIGGFIESDKNKIGKSINKIKVLRTEQVFSKKNSLLKKNLVLAIGDIKKREKLIKFYSGIKRVLFPTIIDPSSNILKTNTNLGKGCIISVGATILNNCKVNDFCIIGTSATVLHDTSIGRNCLIGGHAVIGANANINHSVFIGVGAIIPSSAINIGSFSYICSGSVVMKNVKSKSKILGNPAKKII